MAEYIDKLLYASGIDVSGFQNDAKRLGKDISSLGEHAKKTWERQFGRELAKNLDPNITKEQLATIKKQLNVFSKETRKTFEQTFSRRAAQNLFKPFIDETQTFTGKLKSAFKEAFDIKKFALGTAAGIGLVELTRALGRALSATQKFSAEFEYEIARIRSIAGEGFDDLTVIKEIEDIARRVPQDLQSLSTGLFQIITSGVRDVGEATQVLELAAKTAVAGSTDAKVAADVLTTAYNAMGFSVEELGHVSDILFTTVDQGKIFFDQLAGSIGEVLNPAKLLGVSLEDVGAAFAVMTKAGIGAEETATALKNLFVKIVAATPEAREFAKTIGIDLSQAGIKAAGGFAAYVKQIAELTQGKAELLKKIVPELRAFKALTVLAGTNADEFQRLSKNFNNLEFTAGRTEKVFKNMSETMKIQSKLLKDNLTIAMKKVGDTINSVLLPVVKSLNNAFSDTTPIQETINKLDELGAKARDVAFFELRTQLRNMKDDFVKLQEEQAKFNKEFILKGRKTEGFAATSQALVQLIQQTNNVLSAENGIQKINERIAEVKSKIIRLESLRGDLLFRGVSANDEQVKKYDKLIKANDLLLSFYKKSLELKQRENSLIEKRQNLEKQLQNLQKTSDQQAENQRKAQEKAIDLTGKSIEEIEALIQLGKVDEKLGNQKILQIKQQQEELKKVEKIIERLQNTAAAQKATSELEKQLIIIRQKAVEQRKLVGENIEAIKLINDIEAQSRADALAKFRAQLANELSRATQQELESKIKKFIEIELDFQIPRLQSDLSKLNEDIDTGLRKSVALLRENAEKLKTASDAEAEKLITQNQILAEQIFRVLNQKLFAELKNAIPPELENLPNEVTAKFFDVQDKVKTAIESLGTISSAEFENVIAGIGEDVTALESLIGDRFSGLTAKTYATIAQNIGQIEAASVEMFNRLGSIPQNVDKFADELRTSAAVLGDETVNAVDEFLKALFDIPFDDTRNDIIALVNAIARLTQGVATFGIKANTLDGLLRKLGLQFKALRIDDVSKRMKLFSDEIRKQFGAEIPREAKKMQRFIKEAFQALDEGGERLRDFMKNNNLAELTDEELRKLVENMIGFVDNLQSQRQQIDQALVRIADSIDMRIGDIVFAFQKFSQAMQSQSLASQLTAIASLPNMFVSTISLIGSLQNALFNTDKKAEEAKRQQEKRIADATRDLANAFRELESEIRANEIAAQDLIDEGLVIAGQEFDRAARLIALLGRNIGNFSRNDISFLSEAVANIIGRLGELPSDINVFMQELYNSTIYLGSDGAAAVLRFLKSIKDLPEELRISALRMAGEIGLLDDAMKNFGKSQQTFSNILNRLQLQFDLFNIENVERQFELFRAKMEESFGIVIPASVQNIREFIDAAFAAMQKGGEALVQFLIDNDLEEMSANEFEAFVRELARFASALDDTTVDLSKKFEKFKAALDIKFSLFDIDGINEQFNLFAEEIEKQFGIKLPRTARALDNFIRQVYEKMQELSGAELRSFLKSIGFAGLADLTKDELVAFLGVLDDFSDNMKTTTQKLQDVFSDTLSNLQLEFKLFDINTPSERLRRFRDEINKQFGALLPTATDQTRAFLRAGFDAIKAGENAVLTFLKSVNLEELTVDQFKSLLQQFKDLSDAAKKEVEGVQAVTVSQTLTKTLTFEQGNRMLSELVTMRVIQSEILDIVREKSLEMKPVVVQNNYNSDELNNVIEASG